MFEQKLKCKIVTGSKDFKMLMESDDGYIELPYLNRHFENQQIVEDSMSRDESFDYAELTIKSRRILNRMGATYRLMGNGQRIEDMFAHLTQEEELMIEGRPMIKKVVDAWKFEQWVKELKICSNPQTDCEDLMVNFAVSPDFTNKLDIDLIVSALNGIDRNSFMESHLFCKQTDNKELLTHKNHLRQDLKA
jgi:hypothetical protein